MGKLIDDNVLLKGFLVRTLFLINTEGNLVLAQQRQKYGIILESWESRAVDLHGEIIHETLTSEQICQVIK